MNKRDLRTQARVHRATLTRSDYADAIARFAGKGLAGFIQKPFAFPALREKLQEIFPARPPA